MLLGEILHEEVQFINIKVKTCLGSTRCRDFKYTTHCRMGESLYFAVDCRIQSFCRNTIGYHVKDSRKLCFNFRSDYNSTFFIMSTRFPLSIHLFVCVRLIFFPSGIIFSDDIRLSILQHVRKKVTNVMFTDIVSKTVIRKSQRNIVAVIVSITQVPSDFHLFIQYIVMLSAADFSKVTIFLTAHRSHLDSRTTLNLLFVDTFLKDRKQQCGTVMLHCRISDRKYKVSCILTFVYNRKTCQNISSLIGT